MIKPAALLVAATSVMGSAAYSPAQAAENLLDRLGTGAVEVVKGVFFEVPARIGKQVQEGNVGDMLVSPLEGAINGAGRILGAGEYVVSPESKYKYELGENNPAADTYVGKGAALGSALVPVFGPYGIPVVATLGLVGDVVKKDK